MADHVLQGPCTVALVDGAPELVGLFVQVQYDPRVAGTVRLTQVADSVDRDQAVVAGELGTASRLKVCIGTSARLSGSSVTWEE